MAKIASAFSGFGDVMLRTRKNALPIRKRMKSKTDRVEHLVHGARRFGTAGFADDFRRHARDGDVVRHGLDHDGARRDARAMADLDIAEDLGAGADQHAVADLRMAVLVLLAGAAERDAMQDR